MFGRLRSNQLSWKCLLSVPGSETQLILLFHLQILLPQRSNSKQTLCHPRNQPQTTSSPSEALEKWVQSLFLTSPSISARARDVGDSKIDNDARTSREDIFIEALLSGVPLTTVQLDAIIYCLSATTFKHFFFSGFFFVKWKCVWRVIFFFLTFSKKVRFLRAALEIKAIKVRTQWSGYDSQSIASSAARGCSSGRKKSTKASLGFVFGAIGQLLVGPRVAKNVSETNTASGWRYLMEFMWHNSLIRWGPIYFRCQLMTVEIYRRNHLTGCVSFATPIKLSVVEHKNPNGLECDE